MKLLWSGALLIPAFGLFVAADTCSQRAYCNDGIGYFASQNPGVIVALVAVWAVGYIGLRQSQRG